MNDERILENRYQQESDQWLKWQTDPESKRIGESWFQMDTIDAWRHKRMYACIDPILALFPESKWLTVGDGRFGKDANFILSKGHEAVASDISDTLLKIGAERGFIRDFKVANAEGLPFDSRSFDFVLCKESYHHFPRPMIALYEMIRVAKKGVVLIEPCEAPTLESKRAVIKGLIKRMLLRFGFSSFLRTGDVSLIRRYEDSFEDVGNYVYSISEREIEKAALGMGYRFCAFKGLNDYYEKGLEFEKATEDSPVFSKVKENIAHADSRCKKTFGGKTHDLLIAVVFKQPLDAIAVQALTESGFTTRQLPENPHLMSEFSSTSE